MTGMLASVANMDEAIQVAAIGVDIIDLKAPAAGALGALKLDDISQIKKALGNHHVVSATVGDLPMDPAIVTAAVQAMHNTSVDYIKLGFFPGGNWRASIEELAIHTNSGSKLIAVFFGDTEFDLSWINNLAQAGFAGVMLDTMDKERGSLPQLYSRLKLAKFIAAAKQYGLLIGLAGSLRERDIPALLELNPDYLGFRGALCQHHRRIDKLDPTAVRSIRARIYQKLLNKTARHVNTAGGQLFHRR